MPQITRIMAYNLLPHFQWVQYIQAHLSFGLFFSVGHRSTSYPTYMPWMNSLILNPSRIVYLCASESEGTDGSSSKEECLSRGSEESRPYKGWLICLCFTCSFTRIRWKTVVYAYSTEYVFQSGDLLKTQMYKLRVNEEYRKMQAINGRSQYFTCKLS